MTSGLTHETAPARGPALTSDWRAWLASLGLAMGPAAVHLSVVGHHGGLAGLVLSAGVMASARAGILAGRGPLLTSTTTSTEGGLGR